TRHHTLRGGGDRDCPVGRLTDPAGRYLGLRVVHGVRFPRRSVMSEQLSLVFVCTGNICRSPMAEKILASHLYRAGLANRVRVSSAGTTAWHVGADADPRTNATLRRHGYP